MSRMPMPFANPRTYPGHSGVDFPQPRGTAIRASGRGVVLRIRWTLAGGWWTTIRYDNGVTLGYGHQDRRPTVVKKGERVAEGSVIGYVGKLGLRSTGYHLHLTDVNNQTYAATMARLDTSRVVGVPRPTTATTTTEGDDIMIMFIKGKAGARRGGLYLITSGQAKYLGAHAGKGFPSITDDAEIRELQKHVKGIG